MKKTILLALMAIAFCACHKDDTTDITFNISGNDDLYAAYNFTVTYPTPSGRVEESVQLPWSKTVKKFSLPVMDSLTWVAKPKSNYAHKDSYSVEISISGNYDAEVYDGWGSSTSLTGALPTLATPLQIDNPQGTILYGSYKFTLDADAKTTLF